VAEKTDAPTLGDQVRYQVDRFLSWNPMARFVGLFGLSLALVLFNAVLARLVTPANEEPSDFLEAMWWALGRVADAGTMGDDKGTLVRAVAIFTTLCGVGVVALLIGLVSSTIGEKIDDLRKGKSPVIDQHHTLILGWGEKVFAILRELREANANQPGACVVILSEADKEDVETTVRERMGDMRGTRIVVRQGNPCSVHDLKKVAAGRAKSIIVLSAEAGEARSDAGASDMQAIKTLLALRRIPGALHTNHVVVELADSQRQGVIEQLGAGGVEVVAMAQTLSRMMVQTARQNGLAAVYRDLLSYEGSEFYFKNFPELAGQPFGVAQWKMKDAVVCGVRTVSGKGRASCIINPSEEFVLGDKDELLVIAQDDDSFSLTAQHEPPVDPIFRGASPVERAPERLLVCGKSPKLGDMLREFDHYVLPGSEAWLMPGQDKDSFGEYIKAEVGGLSNLKLKHVEGDPTVPDALRRVVTSDFAVAMVVADTDMDPEEADAKTVITVLLLRDLLKSMPQRKPRIISEILDPRTKDLLEQDYGADFVVSSEITSMLMAQVSERRELNAVFADLFDSEGNEVYLKRAECFATLEQVTSWLAVQKVARDRHEVAIGYVKLGQAPLINPPQAGDLVFTADDRVIVLAENDSEAAAEARGDPSLAGPLSSQASTSDKTQPVGRSPLLPPEVPKPQVGAVSAGPRVAGPSTMPRLPLPPKPK
jgi:ion channel POLLUX/CASTOR